MGGNFTGQSGDGKTPKRSKTPKDKKSKKKSNKFDNNNGFEKLIELDVSHNEISELEINRPFPSSIIKINISYNLIQEFPDNNINLCKKLKFIYASHNRLGKFPDGLGSLFKIEEADFSYNNIQTVRLFICLCVLFFKRFITFFFYYYSFV